MSSFAPPGATAMLFVSKLIMIIGSSMVQKAHEPEEMGFGIGFSNWYSRLADILIRGQSGYNSRWTLMRYGLI